MRIAMYIPQLNIDGFDANRLWPEHSEHTIIFNRCDEGVKVVYSVTSNPTILGKAARVAEEYKIPLVCWCFDIPWNFVHWRRPHWHPLKEGYAEKRYQAIDKTVELLHRCNKVISASKWTQYVLSSKYDIKSEQMYFCVDDEGMKKVPQDSKKKDIVQISRYAMSKNFDTTIEAMRFIPDFRAKFIGPQANAYTNGLAKLSRNLHCNTLMLQQLRREVVVRELKKSTLLVSPTSFEGFGITPVEALTCGVPVVLSDLPVFREVYGDAVPYHQVGNQVAMGQLLREVVNDSSMREKILEDCKPIIEQFTLKAFAKRWDEFMAAFMKG